MSRLRVAPIVEGHGEVQSVRRLLERLWYEHLGGDRLEVLQPIRQPRTKLVASDTLRRAIRLAEIQLGAVQDDLPALVLLLIDADEDPVCELAPRLTKVAAKVALQVDFACVLANPEYETWFVGAAESLGHRLDLPSAEQIPDAPEVARSKKAWIKRHMRGVYSETVDQPSFTASMDLELCRKRCPSFDKLWRELDHRAKR